MTSISKFQKAVNLRLFHNEPDSSRLKFQPGISGLSEKNDTVLTQRQKPELIQTASFVFFVFLILLTRWYYVERFAVALPFWDQWDAEWVGLIKPWREGKFQFSSLWAPHNEHRILPTRVLTLLCFELTGTWSNLTETRANIPLGAATPLLLIYILFKLKEIHNFRWLVIFVVIAGAVLPFSWENILIGFQSQFYFINLFTLAAISLAALRPDSNRAVAGAFFLSVLSILTMASGLLTPAAVALVYLIVAMAQKNRGARSLFLIALFGLSALVGLLTMPHVAGHNFLHAQNITEFVKTCIRIMGWPLTAHKLYIGLMWLPSLITLPTMISRQKCTKADILMAGCFLWTGMQVLALAFGRGHDLFDVSSRYTEVLLLGLAGNAWFVLRAVEIFGTNPKAKIALAAIASVFFWGIFISHKQRAKSDLLVMKLDHQTRMIQTKNVSEYLRTANPAVLQQPRLHIPYPKADNFQKILDQPGIRDVLPVLDLPAND